MWNGNLIEAAVSAVKRLQYHHMKGAAVIWTIVHSVEDRPVRIHVDDLNHGGLALPTRRYTVAINEGLVTVASVGEYIRAAWCARLLSGDESCRA